MRLPKVAIKFRISCEIRGSSRNKTADPSGAPQKGCQKEQLFVKLRKAGIVKSFRSSSGGYVISHQPELLRITDILKAVDQDLDLAAENKHIEDKKGATKEENLASKMWEQLSANMYVFLHQMRLSDIANDQLNPCPAVPNFVSISDS